MILFPAVAHMHMGRMLAQAGQMDGRSPREHANTPDTRGQQRARVTLRRAAGSAEMDGGGGDVRFESMLSCCGSFALVPAH